MPRPTANGEVWVFNKNYTQYIPLSVYELRAVVMSPAVYVLDCSGAGVLLPHFAAPMPRHHAPPEEHSPGEAPLGGSGRDRGGLPPGRKQGQGGGDDVGPGAGGGAGREPGSPGALPGSGHPLGQARGPGHALSLIHI